LRIYRTLTHKVEVEKKKELSRTLKDAVLERLSEFFLPEFLNRLDDIIVFQVLTQDNIRSITTIMINIYI
jgi:ATP-dependent Clp protease ATP-binding subunit ClpA